VPKCRVFQLKAYRQRFHLSLVLWVRSASTDGPRGLAAGPIYPLIEKEFHVQVFVRDNNVDQALKALKKKMQRVSSAR